MTLEYKQSLTELDTILNNMNTRYLKKLPNTLIDFIQNNKDNTYIPNIDKNVALDEQNLKKDTKVLISLIYRNYWCDKKTKEKLLKEDLEQKRIYEEELKEKYNPDNIFKNKKNIQINDINIANNKNFPVKYKESLFSKFMNFIKNIFKVSD